MTEFLKLITFSLLLLGIFGSTFSKQPNYFLLWNSFFSDFLFLFFSYRTKDILKTDKKAAKPKGRRLLVQKIRRSVRYVIRLGVYRLF